MPPKNVTVDHKSDEILSENTDRVDVREHLDDITDNWYLMLAPHEDLTDKGDELLTNASEFYVLATGAEDEYELMDQKGRVDYYMRLSSRKSNPQDEIFLSPRDGITAGALTVELAHIAPREYRERFFNNAEKIFATVALDPRLDASDKDSSPKQEAVKYLFDARQSVIREKLALGELDYPEAADLFVEHATKQGKKFLEQVTDKNLRDGELYEHYVEILARYICWSDEKLDEWYIRPATPREDMPHMNQGHAGAKFATDMFIGDVKSDEEVAIQVKLHTDFSDTHYDESVIVFTGDAYTQYLRTHMTSVVKAINASYKFKESDGQAELLAGEANYLKQQLINKALRKLKNP